MLPENLDSRATYIASREFRNRLRNVVLKRLGGDIDAFAADQRESLSLDLDLEFVREQADFMESEGQLSEPVREALQELYGWAEELKRRLAA